MTDFEIETIHAMIATAEEHKKQYVNQFNPKSTENIVEKLDSYTAYVTMHAISSTLRSLLEKFCVKEVDEKNKSRSQEKIINFPTQKL